MIKKLNNNQSGFSVIEVIVSVALLGIVIAGSSNAIIVSMHANEATRSYASVMTDVYQLVDDYRSQSYISLLSKFGSDFKAITNGQTVIETATADRSRATYSITLTAIKSASNSNPEAIQVNIAATHRRGKFGEATYDFNTIISQYS